jgi:hypothetical protein
MIDGPASCSLPTRERLALLLAQRKAFRALNLHSTTSFRVDGTLAFDIAGGLCTSYCPASALQLAQRWLPSRVLAEREQGTRLPQDLKDFCMDPAQDLFAFVEGHRDGADTDALDGDEFVAAGTDGVVKLHLRTLGSCGTKTHPEASQHTLSVFMQQHLSWVKIAIAGDALAVFTFAFPSMLAIWNWKTGDRLVVCFHFTGSQISFDSFNIVFLSGNVFTRRVRFLFPFVWRFSADGR